MSGAGVLHQLMLMMLASCGVECGLPAQADAHDARSVACRGLPAQADAHDVLLVRCLVWTCCAMLCWVSGVDFLHQLMLMMLASFGVWRGVPAPADAHDAAASGVWCGLAVPADAHDSCFVRCLARSPCTI